MKTQLQAAQANPLRLVLRAIFMLVVPLASYALFAGSIHVTHATDYILQMNDHSYQNTTQPADGANISIPVGGTVEWTNPGPLSHNVAILNGPEVNVSPEVKPGDTWSMTFNVPGTYHYFCEFHPGMEGDVIVGGSASTAPVGRGVQTFAETGKTVRGLFLDYWNAHGGLAQQGFPISEEVEEKSDTDGKFYTVQYFERAVMEYHPENSAPNNVLLSLLGNFLYKQKYPDGAPGQEPNTSDGSVLFPETGHRVGGLFLDYWNSHGGPSRASPSLTSSWRRTTWTAKPTSYSTSSGPSLNTTLRTHHPTMSFSPNWANSGTIRYLPSLHPTRTA
jgi:plastocyanin